MKQYIVKIFNYRGKEPFVNWLKNLDNKTQDRILHRINGLMVGYFGDYKRIDNDILELRFFFGAGYRVYFAFNNNEIIILLCGGDKNSQIKDIKKAKEYFEIYLRDKNGGK